MKVILFLFSMKKYIFILPEYIINTINAVIFWSKYRIFKFLKSLFIFPNKEIIIYNFFERRKYKELTCQKNE